VSEHVAVAHDDKNYREHRREFREEAVENGAEPSMAPREIFG
jgi:hypothetical protein